MPEILKLERSEEERMEAEYGGRGGHYVVVGENPHPRSGAAARQRAFL